MTFSCHSIVNNKRSFLLNNVTLACYMLRLCVQTSAMCW